MKEEEINKLYFDDVNRIPDFGRRDFLKKIGGGLIIVLAISELSFIPGFNLPADDKEIDLNIYLRVREDGMVDYYTGKIEMGQGVITSLAQILAEELEISIQKVNPVMGDTELCPYDAGTWGSLTTRFFDPLLRIAAVEARRELIQLASKKMDCPVEDLHAVDGFIYHEGSGNKIAYAELTKGEKIIKTIKDEAILKKMGEFKVIGKPIISVDAVDKVTGKTNYSADIQLPGMLYASIVRPPALDLDLLNLDTREAEEIDGVRIVRDGNLVAVLHEDPEMAMIAAVKVRADWSEDTKTVNDESIFDYILSKAKDVRSIEDEGDLIEGEEASDYFFKKEYRDGYKAHASIETHVATAMFEDDKLILWASTQTPFGTRKAVSDAMNLDLEKVHVKQIFLGGGFGGKIYSAQAIEAAKIAKLAGVPVQLTWSREEEFQYDHLRPAAVVKINSGVSKSGNIISWDFKEYCAGARGTKLFYTVDHFKTRSYNSRGLHPLKTGAWRAPGNNTTTFARESQMDIMAHKIGVDPLEFRLKNLKDEQMKATLELAAKKFKYTGAKTETGNGVGIALGFDAGTRVALIAEVKVDKISGEVLPVRMVCAQDMGQVVNPHGATVQTEGGLTMGIGYALYEDIKFSGGTVNTRNLDKYEFTRFSVTPKIECVFIDAMDSPPQGGGEPAIVCVGGAIANAVFNACGARVMQMPITPERILDQLR